MADLVKRRSSGGTFARYFFKMILTVAKQSAPHMIRKSPVLVESPSVNPRRVTTIIPRRIKKPPITWSWVSRSWRMRTARVTRKTVSDRPKSSALVAEVECIPVKRRMRPSVASSPIIRRGMMCACSRRRDSSTRRILPKEKSVKRSIMVSPTKRIDSGDRALPNCLANAENVEPARTPIMSVIHPIVTPRA